MSIKFTNDKPIFLQMAEIIKSEIMIGKYKVNDKLPSVREFALLYAVNPNTVQKALQLLEDDKLIVTDRTNGKYVANNNKTIEEHKLKVVHKEIEIFVEKMRSLGLSIEEIVNLINIEGE